MLQKLLGHEKSDRSNQAWSERCVSLERQKAPSYNPVVVQFPYDMSLANILIPSSDEKRRLMFETVPAR